ncbi:SMC-Scp complex subunit ScpB [Sporolactobacillus sp. THM7-7]|nr:SMC-Scp complex subunit ScpB [Sporolactobacillus sp. THM7-7]
MTPTKMRSIIEGLLYLTGEEGLLLDQIAKVFPDAPEPSIREILEKMKRDYEENEASGLMIVEIAGGWRLVTKPFMATYAEQFAAIPKMTPLSQASLETVAIIAYRQPISRMEIEEVRGVKSEKALHTLMAKGLIKEVGRAEGIGRPILYGITPVFLDYFGLRSLEDLPPLSEAVKDPGERPDEVDLLYNRYKETVKEWSDDNAEQATGEAK